jgi:NTP pyrophosphatase (non-canonical NTP hydrolase)
VHREIRLHSHFLVGHKVVSKKGGAGVSTDEQTTLADLKRDVQNFCEERGWDAYHTPKDVAIGLVTEASELLEIFRFVDSANESRVLEQRGQDIRDELADSLYFILRFAQLYRIDLAQALRHKLEKNAQRYPVGSRGV